MEKYIAGFFDGEGNVHKIIVKNCIQYQVRMWQAGERGKKLLEEIQQFLGYGKIYIKRHKTEKWQDVWELNITRKRDIKDFKDRVGKYCKLKIFPKDEELIPYKSK